MENKSYPKSQYDYYGIVAGQNPIIAIAIEKIISSVQRSAQVSKQNLVAQRQAGAKRVNYEKAHDHSTDRKIGLGILFFTIPILKIKANF